MKRYDIDIHLAADARNARALAGADTPRSFDAGCERAVVS